MNPRCYADSDATYFLMAAQAMATATRPDPSRAINGDALGVVSNCAAGAGACLAPLLAAARGESSDRRDVSSAWALDTNASPHADTASPIQSAFLLITSVPS